MRWRRTERQRDRVQARLLPGSLDRRSELARDGRRGSEDWLSRDTVPDHAPPNVGRVFTPDSRLTVRPSPSVLRHPSSVLRLPSSVFRLPSSVFRLPSSVLRPPSSAHRAARPRREAHLPHRLIPNSCCIARCRSSSGTGREARPFTRSLQRHASSKSRFESTIRTSSRR
jgi:hypothetical protein